MKLSDSDLWELADLAISAATAAGHMIARSRAAHVRHKGTGASLASQVVTDIDLRSEAMILDALGPTLDRFGLGLLTEERVDDRSRFTNDYFWCIDPLDGTLPFIEGEDGYAVSIALVARDGTPVIGVVFDPAAATLLHAILGVGAFVDGEPWPTEVQPAGDVLTLYADRSFNGRDDKDATIDALDQVARDLGLSGLRLRATAGAVANSCGVLAHHPACYVKRPAPSGGGSLWDFAATACVFHEVGAVATDVGGEPLDLNRSDSTFMSHRGVLFASTEDVAGRVRSALS